MTKPIETEPEEHDVAPEDEQAMERYLEAAHGPHLDNDTYYDLDRLIRIAAGLLSTGHFTTLDQDGEPELVWYPQKDSVKHRIPLVEVAFEIYETLAGEAQYGSIYFGEHSAPRKFGEMLAATGSRALARAACAQKCNLTIWTVGAVEFVCYGVSLLNEKFIMAYTVGRDGIPPVGWEKGNEVTEIRIDQIASVKNHP